MIFGSPTVPGEAWPEHVEGVLRYYAPLCRWIAAGAQPVRPVRALRRAAQLASAASGIPIQVESENSHCGNTSGCRIVIGSAQPLSFRTASAAQRPAVTAP